MIATTDRRPGPSASAGTVTTGSAGAAPAGWVHFGAPVRILQVYAILLVLIPPTLIIQPLGAVGTPATVVGWVALLMWIVAVLTPGDNLVRTVVPVRVVLVILAAAYLMRYAMANVGYVPGIALLASDRIVLAVFSWAGIALMAAEGLRDRDELVRVLRTFVWAVAGMAIVGLLQFRAGIDLTNWARKIPGLHENADVLTIQDRSGFRRPAGTATHPIEFGCVIAMALPFAIHLARFDLARTRVRRALPLAAIAIGIPVAVSRSAVLGAAVAGLVVFLGLAPRYRPKALVAVAGFLVLIYATTPGLLGTLRGLFLSTGSDSRINDYGPALKTIRQSPWFGHGPGTFIADATIGNVLDNQYLLTLIELGIIGLVVLLIYFLAPAFLGRGARHRSADPSTRDLGQAFAAASLASAATAYTFDALTFRMFAGVIPLCLGLAGLLWALQRRVVADAGASPARVVLRVPAVEAVPEPAAPEALPEAVVAAAVVPEPALPEAVVAELVPEPVVPESVALAVPEPVVDDAPTPVVPTPVVDPDGVLDDELIALLDGELSDPSRDELDEWSLPVHPEEGGSHDLRRIAVLIGAGAAVVMLVGLPFVVEHDEKHGGVAQVGIAAEPGVAPTSTSSSTTLMGQPARKAAQLRARARARARAAARAQGTGGVIVPASPGAGGGPTTTVPPVATTVAPATTTTQATTPTTIPPTTIPPTTTTTTTPAAQRAGDGATTTTTTMTTTTTTTTP